MTSYRTTPLPAAGFRLLGSRRCLRLIVLASLILNAPAPHAQTQPESLLKAAMDKEVIDGDVKGAIELYKKAAESGKPAVAAEALVRLADCYDRTGHADTRATYERVVREHPNQPKAVGKARAWLDSHPSSASAKTAIRIEQVWAGPNGTLSADGRYLAFADWSAGGKGNLAIRDLRTGQSRLLTKDAGPQGWAGSEPLISPDVTRIFYRWEGGGNDSFRTIGIDGTGMRIVARRGYGDFLKAWSPDGKRIAAVHYNDKVDHSVQIVLISVADGSMTPLKSTAWQEPVIGGFSPDGRYLVYSLRKDSNVEGGIFALGVDGGRETALVQGPASNSQPVWTPDGSRVVFVSDRSGAPALWSVAVDAGQPVGAPVLLRPNVGAISAPRFMKDGSYYYRAGGTHTDAYIADFDEKLLAVANPSLASERFVGSNAGPQLSADGKSVVFRRRVQAGSHAIVVRSTSGSEERTLATGPFYGPPRWFPDGGSMLTLENGANGRTLFRTISIATGDVRTLFEAPAMSPVWETTALSPDGRTFFYSIAEVRTGGGPSDIKGLRLMKRRLDSGEETELYRADSVGFGFFAMAVSADGASLAFQQTLDTANGKRAVMVIPTSGHEPREIYRTDASSLDLRGAMAWTRDGRHIVLGAKCGTRVELQLCALPVEGGSLKTLGLGMQGITLAMISADGRRIGFTATTSAQELWAIRNLLPQSAAVR
jgi:Tol biopolymer transport system component